MYCVNKMHSLRKCVRSGVVNGNIIRYISNPTQINTTVEKTDVRSTDLKSWREIPGPSKMMMLAQHFNGAHETPMFDVMHKMYGPIVKVEGVFGARTLVMLLDAEASAEVLRSENWLPVRPGFDTLEIFRKDKNKDAPDSPTGLVTDHGEVWKKFRSTVNPILLQPKTIRLYRNILAEVADDTVSRLKAKRNAKNIIEAEFDLEMNLWALESIGVIALGRRLHCLDTTLPETSPVRRLIQTARDIFLLAERLEFKPNLWRYVPTPMYRQVMKRYEELERLTKYFVGEARNELTTKSNKKCDDERGVLEKLLEIDENMAVIMASDMLFGGVDTIRRNFIASEGPCGPGHLTLSDHRRPRTPSTLEVFPCYYMMSDSTSNSVISTLYLLATNPEKQNKLREEILSNDTNRAYLKACVKESMRMMPVVTGNARKTSKEYNLLGYRIPKDVYIVFAHQYLSMVDNNFPRPNEYIPERWIADKDDPLYYRNAHPFAFNPFGFGARSCIGRRIAELEIETFISKAIQNFRVEWFGTPMRMRMSSINYAVGPFHFVFNDA